MNWYRFALPALLFLFQAACATSDHPSVSPADPAETLSGARQLAADCEGVNRALESTRGIGRITLTQSGRPRRLRFAWSSVVPDKLRAVVLGLDGRPLVTASVDGTWFYYHDHTTGAFRRESARSHRLKTALGLPLEVDSLTRLLAGRLPVFTYDRVQGVAGRNPDESGIILKRGWNRVGRVYVQPAGPTLAQVEAYRRTGELRYRVDINKYLEIKGFKVPGGLTVQDDRGNRVELDIERYWANEPVPPETFRLEPPK